MVSENTESDHDTRVDIPVNRKVMTRLGKGLRNAYIHTEAPTISDFLFSCWSQLPLDVQLHQGGRRTNLDEESQSSKACKRS